MHRKSAGVSALMTVALAWPAHAYTILAPDAVVAGRSIADWTSAWWTWAMQAPAATNPQIDMTGGFANVNNNGPVFFVTGTFGTSDPVTRTFSVPDGRPVLLPMITFFDTEPAEIDPPTATLSDRETAASSLVSGWLAAVDTASLFASIDGAPVNNPADYLEVTGFFSMGPTQAGSLIAALGVPVGAELTPTKSAGYWLMITGLEPGPHTLHFGGSGNAFTPAPNCCTNGEISAFSNDVTDSIFVPEPASALLVVTGLLGMAAVRRSSRPA